MCVFSLKDGLLIVFKSLHVLPEGNGSVVPSVLIPVTSLILQP